MPAGEGTWPEALDALEAAPEHHLLLFENERVRVLDASIPPGQTVPLHTHCWPSALYILSWSDVVRRAADGNVVFDSREDPTMRREGALWSGPLGPHSVENVGDSALRVIAVEIKDA